MKNNIIKSFALSIFALGIFSCESDDDATGYSNLQVESDVTATLNMQDGLAASQTVREADLNAYSYTVTLNKTQPVDIHLTISQVGGDADDHDIEFDHEIVIPAYSTSATGTIKILNDDEDEETETASIRIGGPNTSNAVFTPVTVDFTIEDCFSDLAGTYAYTTTNVGEPNGGTVAGPLTGSVTFTQTEPGKYSLSDASFGGWVGLYGAGNFATGVSFLDLCGQLSYSGLDQFNETFFISNLEILGSTMSFHWENDYGEYGDTTLTRTDGTNWPPLFL